MLGRMSLAVAEAMPAGMVRIAGRVPFELRPGCGAAYRRCKASVSAFRALSGTARRDWICERVVRIAEFAYRNIPFYRELYDARGFRVSAINSFDDLTKVPVVTRDLLQQCPLAHRSSPGSGRRLVNTGGSSGVPLEMYVDGESIGREWAHMHEGWRRLGYDYRHVKLTFVGRHRVGKAIAYDAVRNHFAVNVFAPVRDVIDAVRPLLRSEEIRFLHGYPSAIHSFLSDCSILAPDVVQGLRRTLQGVLLGSEFPDPFLRQGIVDMAGAPSISWYGHTERTILAFENTRQFVYEPYQTYGFCEAAVEDDSGRLRLLGTGYDNYCSPLIRYWTGDYVGVVNESAGLLNAFEIREGRSAEYLVDRSGVRIFVTAFLFGRHHKAFAHARSIQLYQARPGEAEILICPSTPGDGNRDWEKLFDLSEVAIEFGFRVIEKPVLSVAGKRKLMVSSV